MKKTIAILGSTGSIGKNLIKIVEKNVNDFKVELLSANKNYKDLYKQAIKLNVKNIIISDDNSYKLALKYKLNKKIKIHNSFNSFNKIFKKKIDYTMSSITGLDGLKPTLDIIKHTKTIAIANKESIICGWNLILKEIKKNKVNFIPVDSEHFSIWYASKNIKTKIDKIILTASGGPFFNLPFTKFKDIKISQALKHPNWRMGKKISIDSATMMNKVFEIIEAKKIFDIKYKDLSILIHPKSYIHAIVKFSDGIIKLIAHDTDMKIPIQNTLYEGLSKNIKTTKIDIKKLNNLNLSIVNKKKFPFVDIIKNMPNKTSLYETVLVSANDEYVKQYLNNSIKFTDIHSKLLKFIKKKEFIKYKRIFPKNIKDIITVNNYVRMKISLKSI
jgi:1-deoxy-D-xylulose-5-phosphate reductoisomerase